MMKIRQKKIKMLIVIITMKIEQKKILMRKKKKKGYSSYLGNSREVMKFSSG